MTSPPPLAAWPVVLTASVLLGACAGAPGRRAPGHYAYTDSPTQTCRQSPALCAKMPGEQPVLPLSGATRVAATAGVTGSTVVRALEATEQARIEEVLKECADSARSNVLLEFMGGQSPTRAQCNEEVVDAAQGRRVTRAMQLGLEMHERALKCAGDGLDALRPDGFSLEPCYQYDKQTGRVSLVSPEERQALLRQGRSCELLGSLVPDIVIHTGDPLQAQAVYDFKFPCVNIDRVPEWRPYPQGHPHAGLHQGEVYGQALSTTKVWRVIPRLGVIR